MDFELSDDQRMIKDSVDRLLADRYGFEQRKKFIASPPGWSREMWRAYAELGLLGLPFAEAHGGIGGGPVEIMAVMEAFGRSLALEPYLSTVLLGGMLIREAGDAAMQAEILPRVSSGDMLLAFAHLERHSRWNLAHVETTATERSGGWTLDGAKSVVLSGDVADKLLVSARTSGGARDRSGIGLFLIDANASGLNRQSFRMQDGQGGAEISFAAAPAESVLGDPCGALETIERVVDGAIAALCAEAVGAMSEMHSATVDYLKARKQFGRAIGDFQALQHRSVDMHVALELARSMAVYATLMAGDPDPVARRRAVSAAKVQIGRSGRKIGQEAVQLHGGIGMTMEYKLGHYFKRMTMIEETFGGADHHLDVVADGGGLFAA